MASLKSSPSSSSSVPPGRWKNDVFLSFRGEDTRNNFVDHLYSALLQKGIHAFKDDEKLDKGKPVSTELLKAIEESRFSVVVISKTYADSSWCLDELVKIMECQVHMGQMVLPVFYHVDPSHVRGQKRDFDTAFQQHEDTFKGEMEKVNKWRKALAAAANLSGWHVTETGNGGESAIIKEIVKHILEGTQPSGMEKDLIGIKSRLDELYPLLDVEATEEVLMIGILGMGGIGKTTIAQALFRKIACDFEGSSFVQDVRKNSSSKEDKCALQQKIIGEILGSRNILTSKLSRVDPVYGAQMIQRRFCNKKILLVLDDVDDVEQLEFLAATREWFGPGSRIIITTRDKHLLSDTDAIYKPDFLLMNEAVELFSRHAFGKSGPLDGYEELLYRAIHYASCLPLALKVLGSFFRGRQVGVWEDALNRLGKTSDDKILETLKLSFDGLKGSEKQIFLDIACFFKGKDEEHVTRVLDSFGFHPVIGISILIERSLITVSNKKLHMHDLIQEMGWEIVRESFPNSRLFQLEHVHDFIKGNKSPKSIEAIMLMDNEYHTIDYDAKLCLSADVFASMKKLRLLDIDRNFTSTQPTFLPDELRWLCWNEYPFLSLPIADMCKLVGLEMAKGDIKHLWKGRKILPHLKFIHLKSLYNLRSLPDVSGAPNMERLILSDCDSLEEVHKSLGSHRGLVYLDINGCSELRRLPSSIEMESLETLILSGCECLEMFPEVSPCMVKLSHINLHSCSQIKDLPSSIRYLTNLNYLNLTNCNNLKVIPDSICELKYLKCLLLHNCVKLKDFPEKLQNMQMLEELWLGFERDHIIGRPLKSVGFHSFTNLLSLRKLDLSWREIEEESFPNNLDVLSSLEELFLSGNSKLVQLPVSIFHLSRLKRLEVNECRQLRRLCVLPSSIQVLKANHCISLEKIRDLSKEGEWLYKIWLIQCKKLLEDEESVRCLDKMLQLSFIKKCAAVNHRLSINVPGSKIPSWFTEEKHGCRVTLKLPHKWDAQVMGFVLCGVFHGNQWSEATVPRIVFRIVRDGKGIPMSEVNCMKNANKTYENGNMWISYIPIGFFQQMYHDLQPEDWSHIEGNLHMTIMLSNGRRAVRCGAHIVYKRDVELHQQFTTCISDYGPVVHVSDEDLGYDNVISGNTYVYEEKSDEKMLMPLRSRTSARRSTKSICYMQASTMASPELFTMANEPGEHILEPSTIMNTDCSMEFSDEMFMGLFTL
ncbi:TMV resistance protein N isoform X2 [Lactuca sativa]|uniref:TMV resistance protein N isoform X2 n=1 Tax=Lactuca sativa TaxID=4236 RepID=UPI001C68B19B|nr:TMV resistance protein N isoform X2 [Lactuca sativa]